MASRILVDDLVTQVREMLAEENRDSITDTGDLLPALNRAQDFGTDVLTRFYPDPLLAHTEVQLTSGTQEYPIPPEAFEQRLERIELKINGLFYPVQKIDYKDVSFYETASTKSVPLYWALVGSNYRLFPNVLATYPIRIWFLKEPLKLVPQQGRINIINAASNYVIVDAAGSSLSTEADQLDSYVNIVDGPSGARKATLQIQNIAGNKITFRTVPTRTLVLDTAIDTSLVTPLTGLTINPDDYLAPIGGTCVPFMKKPFSNFLVQYAVAEIRRKLGETDAALEQQVLKEFSDQIEHQWSGRANAFRIQNRSNNWPSAGTRRLIITQG